MVVFSRSVHVDAPVARVFAFVSDPQECWALNPGTALIRAELVDGLPMHTGSVTQVRLQTDNRIVAFRARVNLFEPDHLIESVSESVTPSEVRIETVAENGGTRLTQSERFEPTDTMLADTTSSRVPPLTLTILTPLLQLIEPEYAQRLRIRQEEMLAERLGRRLDEWLDAIRHRIEEGG